MNENKVKQMLKEKYNIKFITDKCKVYEMLCNDTRNIYFVKNEVKNPYIKIKYSLN